MSQFGDLLGGPPPTFLPDSFAAEEAALASGADPAEIAARQPTCMAAWAALADKAYAEGAIITSYAYARTGYHRGLDALRRAGWKGHGPVPWDHEPNRGFLRSLHALGRAAGDISETDEAQRCEAFLADCDPTAASALG
ncbi:MAG: DUF3151 domain-containing protein [Mycobacteriales bacterium]